MTAFDRINSKYILGARIWFAEIGSPMGTEGDLRVSDTGYPEAPQSIANPGDWKTLGKIRTAKMDKTKKSSDIEEVGDFGNYETEEFNLVTKRKLQFTTHAITKEAWQMTFGLLEAPEPGETQAVFASGNESLEGWLCFEFTDAFRSKVNLARMFVRVRLTLQNPLEAKSDPAQADYEAAILANDLAEFTSPATSTPSAA